MLFLIKKILSLSLSLSLSRTKSFFFFWERDCIVLYFARYWITISTLISYTSIGSMSAKFAFKHFLFLLLNGWILMWFMEFFNLILDCRWLLNRIERHMLSTCGERQITVRTYWQKGVHFSLRGKFYMIDVLSFCGNVYIGTHEFYSIPKLSQSIMVRLSCFLFWYQMLALMFCGSRLYCCCPLWFGGLFMCCSSLV